MNTLNQLARQVKQLIENKEAQLSVVVETGYDEAGLVGTKDAYLRLVQEVLQFLTAAEAGELDHMKIDGMTLPHSANIGDMFNWRCEIELDTTTLTSSEAETEQVVDYFYRTSPPSPDTQSTD